MLAISGLEHGSNVSTCRSIVMFTWRSKWSVLNYVKVLFIQNSSASSLLLLQSSSFLFGCLRFCFGLSMWLMQSLTSQSCKFACMHFALYAINHFHLKEEYINIIKCRKLSLKSKVICERIYCNVYTVQVCS
jgi:hypothetical protein